MPKISVCFCKTIPPFKIVNQYKSNNLNFPRFTYSLYTILGDAKPGPYGAPGQRRSHYPTLFDNPEYQLMSREYTNVPMSLAYAPIGLPDPRPQPQGQTQPQPPVTSSSVYPQHTQNLPTHLYPQSAALNGKNQNGIPVPTLNNNAQPAFQGPVRPGSVGRQGSRSEEESDHEYYNELDKLKREMQPLQSARKNETTV